MDRILRGIMRYRVLDRASMVKQFQQVKDNPVVSTICTNLYLYKLVTFKAQVILIFNVVLCCAPFQLFNRFMLVYSTFPFKRFNFMKLQRNIFVEMTLTI